MSSDYENKKLNRSLFLPIFFTVIIWGVKLFEEALNSSFANFGILPRAVSGLKGIFFTPFIHGDFSHLFSNTLPVIILGSMVFYFYPKSGVKAILLIWLTGGLVVWAVARSSYHIGASGLVFGLIAFILFSGILHKKKELYAVSLIIVFLYGSTIQGILPSDPGTSWEGHLSGFVSGIFASFIFMRDKPYTGMELDSLPKGDFGNISISETEAGDTFSEVNYFYTFPEEADVANSNITNDDIKNED